MIPSEKNRTACKKKKRMFILLISPFEFKSVAILGLQGSVQICCPRTTQCDLDTRFYAHSPKDLILSVKIPSLFIFPFLTPHESKKENQQIAGLISFSLIRATLWTLFIKLRAIIPE